MQSIELKVNKLKEPSEDVSIPLGSEKKSLGVREGPGWGEDLGRGKGEQDQVWVWGIGGPKKGWKQATLRGRRWGDPLECTRDLGGERLSGFKGRNLR